LFDFTSEATVVPPDTSRMTSRAEVTAASVFRFPDRYPF
jgi:hypothetical protein